MGGVFFEGLRVLKGGVLIFSEIAFCRTFLSIFQFWPDLAQLRHSQGSALPPPRRPAIQPKPNF